MVCVVEKNVCWMVFFTDVTQIPIAESVIQIFYHLPDFLLVLSVIESGTLKSPNVIVDVFASLATQSVFSLCLKFYY